VRTGEAECGANFYCFAGNALSFFEFSNDCNSENVIVDVDVPETPATSGTTLVSPSFVAVINSEIDPSDLTVVSAVSYSVVSASYNVESEGAEHECETVIDDFSFDAASPGVLKIANPTDYESCKNGITLAIRATANFNNCYATDETCAGQNSQTCSVNIRLRNTNEAPFWLDPQTGDPSAPCYFSTLEMEVFEKTYEFTEFGHSLEDCVGDPDEAETITFSIDPESEGFNLFDVKQCGGKLLVKENANLVYNSADPSSNIYSVTVVATDDELPAGESASMSITVNVLNVNDPPTFVPSMALVLNIDENENIGTAVTNPTPVYAIDLDGDSLTYSLEVNKDDAFQIDVTTGELFATKTFDFEHKASYFVKIQVSDSVEDSPVASSPLLTVVVNDVNDPPYFTSSADSLTFELPETSATNFEFANLLSLVADQDVSDSFGTDPVR